MAGSVVDRQRHREHERQRDRRCPKLFHLFGISLPRRWPWASSVVVEMGSSPPVCLSQVRSRLVQSRASSESGSAKRAEYLVTHQRSGSRASRSSSINEERNAQRVLRCLLDHANCGARLNRLTLAAHQSTNKKAVELLNDVGCDVLFRETGGVPTMRRRGEGRKGFDQLIAFAVGSRVSVAV